MSNKCRIHVISDTHLEMRKHNEIDMYPDANFQGTSYLALCGDVGNPFQATYRSFLHRHAARFSEVFLVAGNHEYYSSPRVQRTMQEVDEQLTLLADELPNVHYLAMGHVVLANGLCFAGSTLWSNVDSDCEARTMDYTYIYTDCAEETELRSEISPLGGKRWLKAGRRLVTWQDIATMHMEQKYWLEMLLNHPPDQVKCIIVLTHHAPSHQVLAEPDKAYASHCEDLFIDPVKVWAYGHTHKSSDVLIDDVRIVSNCYGYPGQMNTGFNPLHHVELDLLAIPCNCWDVRQCNHVPGKVVGVWHEETNEFQSEQIYRFCRAEWIMVKSPLLGIQIACAFFPIEYIVDTCADDEDPWWRCLNESSFMSPDEYMFRIQNDDIDYRVANPYPKELMEAFTDIKSIQALLIIWHRNEDPLVGPLPRDVLLIIARLVWKG
jgi:hypothetical protein